MTREADAERDADWHALYGHLNAREALIAVYDLSASDLDPRRQP